MEGRLPCQSWGLQGLHGLCQSVADSIMAKKKKAQGQNRAQGQSGSVAGQVEAVHSAAAVEAADQVLVEAVQAVVTSGNAEQAAGPVSCAAQLDTQAGAASQGADKAPTQADMAKEIPAVDTPQDGANVDQAEQGGAAAGQAEQGRANAGQAEQQKRWANLFRDNRKATMATPLHQFERTGERLKLDFDDIDTVEHSLGFCLVGCFMGRNPGGAGVVWIADRWRAPYKFYMHKSGWTVFKFENAADRDRILAGGPYFAFGIPLFLKLMPSSFLFDEDGRFIPAWIQIHGLPPDCWTPRVLSLIGSEVGRPLYTDKLTRTRERLTYARLLVEVDMEGSKVDTVPITLPTGTQLDLERKCRSDA